MIVSLRGAEKAPPYPKGLKKMNVSINISIEYIKTKNIVKNPTIISIQLKATSTADGEEKGSVN